MADILLIHGACHGAWCWRDLMPRLSALGHVARAIDLPGAGDDATPLAAIDLHAYRDAVLAAMTGPTVLVGHSLGGLSITAAAAAAPDRIAALVYLCAWAPGPGESGRDLRARYGCEALMAAMRPTPDRLATTFADDALDTVFYPACPPGTADYARPRLRPQPTRPSTDPAPALPPGLNRHYILCEHDRAIPAAAQHDMTRDWPTGHVHAMATDHSPFFSDPARLAEILNEIAKDT